MLQHRTPKTLGNVKEIRHKRSILYDPFYLYYPDQVDLQQQKAVGRPPGSKEREHHCLKGAGIAFGLRKMFWSWRWQLHNVMNVLSATELFLKRLILCYRTFTSIKNFFNDLQNAAELFFQAIIKIIIESYLNRIFNDNGHNLSDFYHVPYAFMFIVFNSHSNPYLYRTDEDARDQKD